MLRQFGCEILSFALQWWSPWRSNLETVASTTTTAFCIRIPTHNYSPWYGYKLFKQYHEVSDSILHEPPGMKKLFLQLEFYQRSSHPFFCTKLTKAVRNNLHLQSVGLEVKNRTRDNDEKAKNADEKCHALLEGYCERNWKLYALDEADTIPLNIWPYVFRLARRGGADMLYRHLRQNARCVLTGWRFCLPKRPSKSRLVRTRSQTSAGAKRQHA